MLRNFVTAINRRQLLVFCLFRQNRLHRENSDPLHSKTKCWLPIDNLNSFTESIF